MTIYFIYKFQITLLNIKKVFINILVKYLEIINIFSKKLLVGLFEYLDINKQVTELIKAKQLFYKSIYSFNIVELKSFKIYMENNLANCFI